MWYLYVGVVLGFLAMFAGEKSYANGHAVGVDTWSRFLAYTIVVFAWPAVILLLIYFVNSDGPQY